MPILGENPESTNRRAGMRPDRRTKLFLCLSSLATLAALPASPPRPVTYPIRAMGTYVHVSLVTADSAGSFAAAAGPAVNGVSRPLAEPSSAAFRSMAKPST